jgi:hypothetical protein
MAAPATDRTSWLPLTGALFVVLTVVAVMLGGDTPDVDAPAREIADFWVDNEGVMLLGCLLEAVAGVLLLFFGATVRRALRADEDGSGVLSVVALAGAIVAATGIGVDASIRFAATELADEVDPVVIQTLSAMWDNFFFPMAMGLATLILATSLSARRTGLIPVWLAWVGIVIVVAFFTPAGFIAFLLGGVWIVVLSVLLWRREAGGAASLA